MCVLTVLTTEQYDLPFGTYCCTVEGDGSKPLGNDIVGR